MLAAVSLTPTMYTLLSLHFFNQLCAYAKTTNTSYADDVFSCYVLVEEAFEHINIYTLHVVICGDLHIHHAMK